jgi:hypothetical protein
MSRFVGVPTRNRESKREVTGREESINSTLSEKSQRAARKRAEQRAQQNARINNRYDK